MFIYVCAANTLSPALYSLEPEEIAVCHPHWERNFKKGSTARQRMTIDGQQIDALVKCWANLTQPAPAPTTIYPSTPLYPSPTHPPTTPTAPSGT